MLGSSILDVAIGMAFIYLLLSLIASTIQEALAAILQTRSANLEHGIRSLFSGSSLTRTETFVDAIYAHGLIRGLYQDPKLDNRGTKVRSDIAVVLKPSETAPVQKPRTANSWRVRLRRQFGIVESRLDPKIVSNPFLLPAYIPSRTFAVTLIDLLSASKDDQVDPLDAIEGRLKALMNPPAVEGEVIQADTPAVANEAAQALLSLLADSKILRKDEVAADNFRRNVENWYNDAMDRTSGWYKKYTQKVLLVIGLVLAVAFNVDSIRVGTTLWFDKDSRQGLVSAANTYITNNTPALSTASAAPPAAADPATSGDAVPTGAPPIVKTLTAPAQIDGAALANHMKTAVSAFNEVSADYLLPVGWRFNSQTLLKDYHSSKLSIPHWVWARAKDYDWDWFEVLKRMAGWLITALALSFGAPFWFDTLNKFMVVRSTVKPQEKSLNEVSKS